MACTPPKELSQFSRLLLKCLLPLYLVAIDPAAARPKPLRHACMTFIVLFLIGRCTRLFFAPSRASCAAAAAAATAVAAFGPLLGLAAVLLPGLALLVYLVATHPDDGVGHRVGAHGFEGQFLENTLEALADLARRDAAGEFVQQHFPFVEFDIQETCDGQLVLFHDHTLSFAFPSCQANAAQLAALQAAGINPATAGVYDLTAAQLTGLCLGGRQGVHVPTLRQFLEKCIECDVRRSLAVEIKMLRSDAGRQELIECLAWYVGQQSARLDGTPHARNKHLLLSWAGLIAFPQYFAMSFGDFGGAEWRRWAQELHRRGIPARSCHFHYLNLLYGA